MADEKASMVIIFGLKVPIDRNLLKTERNYIDARLNLYQKIVYTLSGKVWIGLEMAEGWRDKMDIWLVRNGRDVRLTYLKGFRKEIRWDLDG